MKPLGYFFALLVLVILVSPRTLSQGLKVAFFDSKRVIEDLPEAQKASKELEQMAQVWQDSLRRANDDFQQQAESYSKQKSMMPAAKQDSEEKRLVELQQKLRDTYAQKLDPRTGEIAAEQEKRLAPIREKILKVIEQIAKEDGLAVIFDRANIVYGDAKINLTYKVLDRINRGGPTNKSK
jgi:outer membrane protein